MRISDWSSDVCSSDLATRTGQIARRKFSLPSESLVPGQKSAAVYRNNVTDDQHNAGLTIMQCSMVTRPRLASPQQQGVVRHAKPVHLACRIRSEEHTSELQSLMRISYAVFCLKKKTAYDVIKTYSHMLYKTHN